MRQRHSVGMQGKRYNVDILLGLDASGMRAGGGQAVQEIDRIGEQAQAMATKVNRAITGLLAGFSAWNLIDTADNWGQYASRIEQATRSSEEYDYVQQRMVASANQTFRAISEAREGFIQLSPPLRDMGFTLAQSIDTVDAFSGLLVVNAASADRAAAAQRALSTALMKNRMDADAWMTIVSTMPSVVELLAEKTGRTADEIRALGADGSMSVRAFATVLATSVGAINAQVDDMRTTVRDALISISNGFGEYIGQGNDALGITSTMASGLKLLGENFGDVADVGLAMLSAALLGYTIRSTAAAVATTAKGLAARKAAVDELRLAQTQVAQTQASLAQVTALRSLGASHAQVSAATAAHEAALKRLAVAQAAYTSAGRMALGMLGGPAGLAITAGIVATTFFALRGESTDLAQTLEGMQQPLDGVIERFRQLGSEQQAAKALEYGEAFQLASRQAREAYEELGTAVGGTLLNAGASAEEVQAIFDGIKSAAQDGSSMIPVLQRAAAAAGLGNDVPGHWVKLAASYREANTEADNASAVMVAANNQLSMMAANANAAASGIDNLNVALGSTEADKYLANLKEQHARLQDNGSVRKQATRLLAADTKATQEQRDAVMSEAAAIDALNAKRSRSGGASQAKQEADAHRRAVDAVKDRIAAEQLQLDLLRERGQEIDKVTPAERQALQLQHELASGISGVAAQRKAELLAQTEQLAALEKQSLAERESIRIKAEQDKAIKANAENLKSYRATLEETLAVSRAAAQRDVAGAWLADGHREYLDGLASLDDKYISELRTLQQDRDRALSAGVLSSDQVEADYAQRLDLLRDYMAAERTIYDERWTALRAGEADWTNGASQAIDQYIETSKNRAGQMRDAFGSLFDDLTSAVTDWAFDSDASFTDIAKSFAKMMVEMELRAAASSLMQSGGSGAGGILGSLVNAGLGMLGLGGSGSSSGTSSKYSLSSGGSGLGLKISPNALGGVYSSPSLSTYSNQVHHTPKLFAFAQGGVFAEAGSEAIMPLQRTSSGHLGVRAIGAQAAPQVSVQVDVQNNTDNRVDVQRKSQTMPDGQQLERLIIRIVDGRLANPTSSTMRTLKDALGVRSKT